MGQWNIEQVSNSFLRQAGEAERYCKEVKSKIKSTSSYERIYDEHMAKFHVYNYLHGKLFLESREKLIAELQKMLGYDVKPSECYDLERFEEYRKLYINHEIKNFKNT